MSEFDANYLLENEDQVSIYFHFIDEINKYSNPDPRISQFSSHDAVKGFVAAAAVASYLVAEPIGAKLGKPEHVEKVIEHFASIVRAMDKQTTVKQFIAN